MSIPGGQQGRQTILRRDRYDTGTKLGRGRCHWRSELVYAALAEGVITYCTVHCNYSYLWVPCLRMVNHIPLILVSLSNVAHLNWVLVLYLAICTTTVERQRRLWRGRGGKVLSGEAEERPAATRRCKIRGHDVDLEVTHPRVDPIQGSFFSRSILVFRSHKKILWFSYHLNIVSRWIYDPEWNDISLDYGQKENISTIDSIACSSYSRQGDMPQILRLELRTHTVPLQNLKG
jgi:hypothetical protein